MSGRRKGNNNEKRGKKPGILAGTYYLERVEFETNLFRRGEEVVPRQCRFKNTRRKKTGSWRDGTRSTGTGMC